MGKPPVSWAGRRLRLELLAPAVRWWLGAAAEVAAAMTRAGLQWQLASLVGQLRRTRLLASLAYSGAAARGRGGPGRAQSLAVSAWQVQRSACLAQPGAGTNREVLGTAVQRQCRRRRHSYSVGLGRQMAPPWAWLVGVPAARVALALMVLPSVGQQARGRRQGRRE